MEDIFPKYQARSQAKHHANLSKARKCKKSASSNFKSLDIYGQ